MQRATGGEPPPPAEWKAHIDEMVRQIPEAPGVGLDAQLHAACVAAFRAARECKRLFLGVPFLKRDREAYCELARSAHDAIGELERAHSGVSVHLRRNGGWGGLMALVNDALTIRANSPLPPPASPRDYLRQLQALDGLQSGTPTRGRVFQRRDGMAITEAVFHELCNVPPLPPAATQPGPKPGTERRKPTLERQVANALAGCFEKGVKSVGQILTHLKTPAGADLRELVERILASHPKKKGSGRTRTQRDVIEAAIAMRDRDRRDSTP